MPGYQPQPTPAPPPHPGHGVPPGYRMQPGHRPGYPAPPGYPLPPRYVPPRPALAPNGQPLASFLDRLLAYLVDVAVFVVVSLVLMIPAFVVVFAVVPGMFDVRPDGTIAEPSFFEVFASVVVLYGGLVLVMLGLAYVYYVEMMFRSGQTLGKKAIKIRVVPLNPATPFTRKLAAKRFLVQVVAGTFLPGFSYVDGLWQLWDKPYQQCLHDKFAGTAVVKVPA
jgi:uncharacterized RDD family membrane protein YckC